MAFTERDIKDAHRDEVQDQKRKHRVRQKGWKSTRRWDALTGPIDHDHHASPEERAWVHGEGGHPDTTDRDQPSVVKTLN